MTISPEASVLSLPGKTPVVPESAFVAPGARLIGAVTLGEQASVWYNAVLRGDSAPITIGPGSNLQDNVSVHVDAAHPVRIGANVSVGHNAVVHGCTIGDSSLVGMGSVVLSGAEIGEGCLIAAGAVVLEGTVIPPGSLVAGVPAKVRRALSDEERAGILSNADIYRAHQAPHSAALDPTEITARLAQLAALLVHQGGNRVLDAVPPLELETKLNGGRNPVVGRYYADVLTKDRALPADARILDLGCGYGRIALELASRLTDEQHYVGLDPNAEAVAWARENIARHRPNFSFERIDVTSKPYNPEGTQSGARFRFPFPDASLDRVFMISVLTHVDLDTVRTYVAEAARTLKPETGRLLATFFLLDDEVDALLAAGRSPFTMSWRIGESRVENPDNPELAIAHPRERVLEIVREAGFGQVAVHDGDWSGREGTRDADYQDMLVADFGTVTGAPDAAPDGAGRHEFDELAVTLGGAGVEPDQVTPFLVWAAGVCVNALWWEARGIALVVDGAGALDLPRSRELGLATGITSSDAGAFVAFDDAQLLARIGAAGPVATRSRIVDFLGEIARSGVLVDRALRSGSVPLLRWSTGEVRPAPIPAFRG